MIREPAKTLMIDTEPLRDDETMRAERGSLSLWVVAVNKDGGATRTLSFMDIVNPAAAPPAGFTPEEFAYYEPILLELTRMHFTRPT